MSDQDITINSTNSISMVEECAKCVEMEMWPQFRALFKQINTFYKQNYKEDSDDNFVRIWFALRSLTIDNFMKKIQDCTQFEDYLNYLSLISDLVDDPKRLWVIMHTELQTIFKASPSQCRYIAKTFFTPGQLFEYSIDAFLDSQLCNLNTIATEDDVIDRFYALAGLVRACGVTRNDSVPQSYINYVGKILRSYINLQFFSAKRFVWLVESIGTNLFINPNILRGICAESITEFIKKDISPKEKLEMAGTFTTSPFMCHIPILNSLVEDSYKTVVENLYYNFVKYILPGFADLEWKGKEYGIPSDPARCWKLFYDNLFTNNEKSPIMMHAIGKSLCQTLQFLADYYGSVQPELTRAVDVRRDIFYIVQTIVKLPIGLSDRDYQNIWLLLLIAAIIGAEQTLICNLPTPEKSRTTVMLGLDVSENGYDFINYKKALAVLTEKFSGEQDAIPDMIKYLRQNYH